MNIYEYLHNMACTSLQRLLVVYRNLYFWAVLIFWEISFFGVVFIYGIILIFVITFKLGPLVCFQTQHCHCQSQSFDLNDVSYWILNISQKIHIFFWPKIIPPPVLQTTGKIQMSIDWLNSPKSPKIPEIPKPIYHNLIISNIKGKTD